MQGKTLDFLLRCQAGLVYTPTTREVVKMLQTPFQKTSFLTTGGNI